MKTKSIMFVRFDSFSDESVVNIFIEKSRCKFMEI